jgi:ABC-type transport system involved in multi-copper enzyme maturation permease subunit
MKPSNILSLSRYTFIGNLRSKVFLILILFGIFFLSVTFLLSVLGQEQQIRILTDLGLASIEILSLFTAVFLTVNLILEQIEQRTIYLVLTRSVTRAEYLLGSYLGTLAAIFLCVAAMTGLNTAILLWKGWNIGEEGLIYFASVLLSFEKIALISSVGFFFSLFSSSGVVALVFTFFIWTAGHFMEEVRFLVEKMTSAPLKIAVEAAYFVLPHFQYLNARDLQVVLEGQVSKFVLEGSLYAFLYSSAALLFAFAAFRKKEF